MKTCLTRKNGSKNVSETSTPLLQSRGGTQEDTKRSEKQVGSNLLNTEEGIVGNEQVKKECFSIPETSIKEGIK